MFVDMMEECQYTCSDGECPGLAGNDACEDTSMNCPRDEYLVKTLFKKIAMLFISILCRGTVTQAQMSFTQLSGIASIPVPKENARVNLEMRIVKMKSGPVHTGNMR